MRRRAGQLAEIPVWADEISARQAEKFSYKWFSPVCRDEKLSWRVGCLENAAIFALSQDFFPSFVLKCPSVLARAKLNLHSIRTQTRNFTSYPLRDFDAYKLKFMPVNRPGNFHRSTSALLPGGSPANPGWLASYKQALSTEMRLSDDYFIKTKKGSKATSSFFEC